MPQVEVCLGSQAGAKGRFPKTDSIREEHKLRNAFPQLSGTLPNVQVIAYRLLGNLASELQREGQKWQLLLECCSHTIAGG